MNQVINIDDFDINDPQSFFVFKVKIENTKEISGFNYYILEYADNSVSVNVSDRDSSHWSYDNDGNIIYLLPINLLKVRPEKYINTEFELAIRYMNLENIPYVIDHIKIQPFKKRIVRFDRTIPKEFNKNDVYKIASQSTAFLNGEEIKPFFSNDYIIYEKNNDINNAMDKITWEVLLKDASIDTIGVVSYKGDDTNG